MPKLSIVIPAYNEEKFIGELLDHVLRVPTEELGYVKEVIVVDDGSKDATGAIARRYDGVVVLTQVPNQGKGRAVRRGIQEATGDYILIQDGDLEYDPNDYLALLRALGPGVDSVYGSRTLYQKQLQGGILPGRHPEQRFGPWFAGLLLSIWTLLLYGKWISDTLTAYKLYPAKTIKTMQIVTHGFETDHEITAKLFRAGCTIAEVPIAYHPRSVEEGKKIKPMDGLIAVWTLLKFRFAR